MASSKRSTIAVGFLALIVTTGCATSVARMGVYPTQGQSPYAQSQAMHECEQIARNTAGDPAAETLSGGVGGAVIGAVVGTALGAILGAFIGAPGELAAFGAAMGGGSGAFSGLAGGAQANADVVKANYRACLQARGFAVGG